MKYQDVAQKHLTGSCEYNSVKPLLSTTDFHWNLNFAAIHPQLI